MIDVQLKVCISCDKELMIQINNLSADELDKLASDRLEFLKLT